jgi:phenylacetic acid degradation operon negative regulatory protein
VALLSDFGFSPATSRVALARLVRRDLIEPMKEGRRVFYRITPRFTALLDEGDERIFSLGRAPSRIDHWTVVWHAIPEEMRLERTRLARRLRFLGFGSLQGGTWIAPQHREEEAVRLIRDLGVERVTGVLLGRSPPSFSFTEFAARAWDLPALAERYAAYNEEFGLYARADALADLTEREAFLLRTRLAHIFRQFPFLDPELPDDVIPAPDERMRAIALFHDVYGRHEAPSQEYFDAVLERRAR